LEGICEGVMRMKPDKIFRVIAHVDASFSSHPDEKSQSGIVIEVGGGGGGGFV
jgi:hypothetical protein